MDPTQPRLARCHVWLTSGFRFPRVTTLSRRDAVGLSRVAAHIAAGFRLQRQLAALGPADPFGGAEATLDGGGRLQHAEEPAQGRAARELLRAAAVNRSLAR